MTFIPSYKTIFFAFVLLCNDVYFEYIHRYKMEGSKKRKHSIFKRYYRRIRFTKKTLTIQ